MNKKVMNIINLGMVYTSLLGASSAVWKNPRLIMLIIKISEISDANVMAAVAKELCMFMSLE